MDITTDQSIVGIMVVTVVAGLKEGGMPKWMTAIAVIVLGAAGGLLFIDFSSAGAAEGVATAFFTAGVYGVITGLDKAGKPAEPAVPVVVVEDDTVPMDDAPVSERRVPAVMARVAR